MVAARVNTGDLEVLEQTPRLGQIITGEGNSHNHQWMRREGGEVADLKDENNMPTPTPTRFNATHPVQSRVVRSCFKTGSHTSCTAWQTTLVVMRSEHFTTLVTAETQTGFNGGGKTTLVAW